MTAARFYSSTAGLMQLQADITSLSATMQVDTVTGLPGTTPFTLVIEPGVAASEEIVTVTNVGGTTLTITRGVDGSSATAHSAGAEIRHMATARDFREPQEHIGSSSGVHGLGGTVVGTTDVQTLTNKTAQAADAATLGLLVKGTSGQTADYMQVQDSTAAVVARFVAGGASTFVLPSAVELNRDTAASFWGWAARFTSPAASVVAGIFKRASGQTGDILQVQNESGTVLAKFDKDGKLTTPQVTSTGAVSGTTGTFSGAVSGTTGTFSGQVQSNGLNAVTLSETQTLTNKTLTSPVTTGLSGTTGTFSGSVTAPNLPASSTSKAGKRLHWGFASGTTDASGLLTVTHGAGFTPTSVVFSPKDVPYQNSVEQLTSTTFKVLFASAAGAALASTAVSGYYVCGE